MGADRLGRGPNTIGILLLSIIISVLYLVSRPNSRMQQKAYQATDSPEDIAGKYGHDGNL